MNNIELHPILHVQKEIRGGVAFVQIWYGTPLDYKMLEIYQADCPRNISNLFFQIVVINGQKTKIMPRIVFQTIHLYNGLYNSMLSKN